MSFKSYLKESILKASDKVIDQTLDKWSEVHTFKYDFKTVTELGKFMDVVVSPDKTHFHIPRVTKEVKKLGLKELDKEVEKKELKELKELKERVSSDCSTGSGVIPTIGPYKDFMIVRTSHLDEPRQPGSDLERDENFTCSSFDQIATKFFQRRPLGVQDGDYSLFWRNSLGVQTCIININNTSKKLTFVTIMQLNKRNMNDYRIKQKTVKINLGKIEEPE